MISIFSKVTKVLKLLLPVIGDFQSVCNCCLPRESQNRTISLECEDGSKVQKVYMQPTTCQCLSCSGSSRYLDELNKVEPYRKWILSENLMSE